MTEIEFVEKISNLFIEKGWHNANVYKNSLKSMLCISSKMSEDEREMFYSLTEKFIKVPISLYPKEIMDNIQRIPDEWLIGKKSLHILPLLDPKDEGKKTKSSIHMTYYFRIDEINMHEKFRGIRLYFDEEDRILDDMKQKKAKKRCLIMFVDDFIGSGETAFKCLEKKLKKFEIDESKVIVFSLYTMKMALSKLQEKGIRVVPGKILQQGISSISNDETREKYKECMENVENQIDVPEKYRFGYGRSESLISLGRTPNNTFPIYWQPHKNTPPFERK